MFYLLNVLVSDVMILVIVMCVCRYVVICMKIVLDSIVCLNLLMMNSVLGLVLSMSKCGLKCNMCERLLSMYWVLCDGLDKCCVVWVIVLGCVMVCGLVVFG